MPSFKVTLMPKVVNSFYFFPYPSFHRLKMFLVLNSFSLPTKTYVHLLITAFHTQFLEQPYEKFLYPTSLKKIKV